MPTYFSGDQKCKFSRGMILNVINTSGKAVDNYDVSLTCGHKKTVILMYNCFAKHSKKEYCPKKT